MLFWQLLHAGIASFCGYVGFISFMILGNYPSAVLALIVGTSENIIFFLHFLLRKRELHIWYGRTDLRLICRFGILVAVVGLLNLGYHTTIQVLLNKPIFPIPNSSVIPIVWSILTLRGGILLMYYCIKYQHLDDELLFAENTDEVDVSEVADISSESVY